MSERSKCCNEKVLIVWIGKFPDAEGVAYCKACRLPIGVARKSVPDGSDQPDVL